MKIKRVDSLNFASRFIRWKFSRQREWNEEQSRAGNGESREEMGETSDWRERDTSPRMIFEILRERFRSRNAISRNCETIGSVES